MAARKGSRAVCGRAGSGHGFGAAARMVRDDAAIRHWAIVNACLEAAIGALRTFVVLYLTAGLGYSLRGASGALVLVGVNAVVAAPLAGKLADRFGARRVMLVSVCVFALGLTAPVLTSDTALFVAVVPVAFAALDTVPLLTFADTDGYSAVFAVAVVLLGTSVVFLGRARNSRRRSG